jgi:hypothetical protein
MQIKSTGEKLEEKTASTLETDSLAPSQMSNLNLNDREILA